jgi:hypothetical protein
LPESGHPWAATLCSKPIQSPITRRSDGNNYWHIRCWVKDVPNATFVSSAGRKATRIAGDRGTVRNRFSLLPAKLRAERPGLIALLILPALVGLECSIRADESASPASVATNTAWVVNTNSIGLAAQTSNVETQHDLIFTNQPAIASSTSPTTNQPSGAGLPATTSFIVVIQERSDPQRFSDQSGNGSFGFANIEAGFGQAYENDSILMRGRNGTAWEETRYFFLKKVVKF